MSPASPAIQELLLALFGSLTSIVSFVIGPTYDDLFVPELSASTLFPALGVPGGGGLLGGAADFANYLVLNVADPSVALVAAAVGVLYLARATVSAWRAKLDALLPRLVVGVLVSNLTVPIAGAILGLAGAVFPTVAGWDGGEWQRWASLGGNFGLTQYSWDNGAIAFILSFALLSVILLLAIAVAIRNALLGVLLVLLPLFSLLWPIPYLGTLARRGWLWFVELSFLPVVMVIPLELAVGAPTILLLLAYLVVALAAPALVSVAGASLTQAGFPSAGSALIGGIQRGMAAASIAVEGAIRPALPALKAAGVPAAVTGAMERASSRPALLALPAFASEMLGHGSVKLLGHLARGSGFGPAPQGGGSGAGGSWRAGAVRTETR